jgi:uncharacterized protein YjbJ (UPF0337 family)
MKRIVLWGVVVSSLSGFSSAAFAAPPSPKEKIDNRQDLREDRRETRNDRWDALRLEKLLADYKKASKLKQTKRMKALDDRFMAELALELVESNVELAEKREEVRESKDERNEERREMVKDVVKGRPVAAAHDAAELRDDRRDLRDDRKDRATERVNLELKRNLRDRYQALLGKTDKDSVGQKIGLIEEALTTAKGELVGDIQERAEDRKEIIEDRIDGHRPN